MSLTFCNKPSGPPRTAVVSAYDEKLPTSSNAPVEIIGAFQIRLRDTMDYSIDFSAWLQLNGDAQIASATWAVASGSPKTPVLGTAVFDPLGVATQIVSPATSPAAAIGDVYWLDCTVVTTPGPAEPTLPARTLVRRISIAVVAG